MFYVGVDIAKSNHYACIINSSNEVITKPFLVTNDTAGFSKLLAVIQDYSKDDVLIVLESTSIYGNNLVKYFYNHGYNLTILNPLITNKFRRSSIRNVKNDKVDSIAVAQTALFNSYTLFNQENYNTMELKELSRFRRKLKKTIASLKTELTSCIDVAFPEYTKFFKAGIHTKTSYSILKISANPNKIKTLTIKKLTNILNKSSNGRFKQSKAVELIELTKNSIGNCSNALDTQIKFIITQIELLNSQVEEINTSIEELLNEVSSPILTIPGISNTNASIILGEIGNIDKFDCPAKLVAFAGLDCTVRQSGNFSAPSTRMSKRGSALLRYALINAAWQISLLNDTFAKYYSLKRNQGKRHYSALGHVAKKLVHVIFKMLKDNVSFNPDALR